MISAQEVKWIEERMTTYQIKFRDIHDEILDHVISEISTRRAAGDTTDIEALFVRVIEKHFGGSAGITNLVTKKQDSYNQHIQKLWWQSLSYYLTWPMFGFTAVVLLISLTLPNLESVKWSLLIGCLLLTVSSVIYAYFSLKARVLKTIDGAQLVLRSHLVKKVATSFGLVNWLLFYLPGYAINYLHPVVFMAVTMVYIFLNLAALRFSRQFKPSNPLTR